ncbi:purine-nucleoside phosphorylase [Rubellimicrobium aerolatum]|uniref:Purine nucleoside phosphorylase DeoD-type n=1 Tax=Rubellimicrobium aerolatum TaxID=490979 RepID=A0ABW0S9I3_9RHOB|nr:purine-nucleoside phosphorylase [Rubellimicrobium aerolatum]MBP1804966.1 purine-nucleoside phosphorylase [Rubellimicrobium aerolatum]
MSTHIGARPGEIAETVLLPGDPLRAEWAARTFLRDAVCVNRVRGMLGFTGTWNGHRVTIHGTGMGMPSLSIYANELLRDFGCRTLIRVGSAGAYQPALGLRDVVLAQAASWVSTPSTPYLRDLHLAPIADWGLLLAAHQAAARRGTPVHVGNILSSDTFYTERDDHTALLTRHGVLAVEMETAELYLLAARQGARALAILTISDHLVTGEDLPADDRERSFGEMFEIALAAAFA